MIRTIRVKATEDLPIELVVHDGVSESTGSPCVYVEAVHYDGTVSPRLDSLITTRGYPVDDCIKGGVPVPEFDFNDGLSFGVLLIIIIAFMRIR